jgi:DNA-binding NtrC family response regulator
VSDRPPLAEVLIGDSPVMHELRSCIARYAPSALPVMILGPRGVGKELVAEALHDESGRDGAFVAFNTGAIADARFEDALFGRHEDRDPEASAAAHGYLAEANRGTVFLDEVSGISPANQRTLLRAVETHRFRPVGAPADRTSDFRLVTATNDDVFAMVHEGRFRADLADRFSALVIHVPPLWQRRADIPALSERFLAHADPSRPRRFTAEALAALSAQPWPGNVRELRHAVERAAVLAGADVIDAPDVGRALEMARVAPSESRQAFERRRMLEVMEQVAWNVDRAATTLGVDRTTIYRRLRRLGIGRGGGAVSPGHGTHAGA